MMFTCSYTFAATAPDESAEPAVVQDVDEDVTQDQGEPAAEEVAPPEEEVQAEQSEAIEGDDAALDVVLEEPEAAEEPEPAVKQEYAEEPVPVMKQVKGVPGQFTVETAKGEKTLQSIVDANGNMTAPTRLYSSTQITDAAQLDYTQVGTTSYYKVFVKTSGKLWFATELLSGGDYGVKVWAGRVLDDSAGIIEYGEYDYEYLTTSNPSATGGGIDVKAGNTYCIVVESSRAASLVVVPYVYSYASRTLPAGKTMLSSGYVGTSGTNKVCTILYKIKPTKSGYIRVYLKEYGFSSSSGYVTLLNSKKKNISDKLYYSSSSKTGYVSFGVKKGVTYYLRVANCFGSYTEQNVYGVMYKVYGAAVKSNTSKKKALNLKRKAKYTAVAMPANGKKTTSWYKFKVTKKRLTKVRIDATNVKSGKTTITFYRGKKKFASDTITKGAINTFTLTYSNKQNYVKKGTYYIKIVRSTKANGAIKIRYLK